MLGTVVLTTIKSRSMQPLPTNVEAFAQAHTLRQGSHNIPAVPRFQKQEVFFSIYKALKQQKFNASHSQLQSVKIHKCTPSHPSLVIYVSHRSRVPWVNFGPEAPRHPTNPYDYMDASMRVMGQMLTFFFLSFLFYFVFSFSFLTHSHQAITGLKSFCQDCIPAMTTVADCSGWSRRQSAILAVNNKK